MLDVASPQPAGATDVQPLVAVEGLSVFFPVPGERFWSRARPQVHAVEDVSFTLSPGRRSALSANPARARPRPGVR